MFQPRPVSVEQNKQIRRAAYATLNGVTCSVVYSTNNISINVEADRNPVVTVTLQLQFVLKVFQILSLHYRLLMMLQLILMLGIKMDRYYSRCNTKTYSPAADTDIANGEVITAQVSTAAAAIGCAAQDQCAFTSAPVAITIAAATSSTLTSDKVATSHTICSGDTIVFTATGCRCRRL